VARGEGLPPAVLAAVRGAFSAEELRVVMLMLDGERSTDACARVLGLADLPAPEQAREVKRVKDRLGKRLRRLAPKLSQDE
jgi:hypothetical protein